MIFGDDLARANAHLIRDGVGCAVGGVTLSEVGPGIASIGLLVAESVRSTGYGTAILSLVVSDLAPQLGFRVLRADVYNANTAAIHLLESNGFGEYRNFERNVP